MTFIDDDGNSLTAKSEFSMSKNTVSVFSGSIKGDVSVNFKIDNNSENREVLNYYGVNSIDNSAYTKKKFKRSRNGNILDNGYIIIQGEDSDSLDCFYLSGNSNWVQLLQDNITELDFSDYEKTWDINTIQESPTEGVIFCLADWATNGNMASEFFSILTPTEVQTNEDETVEPKIIPDFYPCFYLHSLLRVITENAGLKISGNINDDVFFKSLVIGPTTATIRRPITVSTVTCTGSAQAFTAGADTQYTSFTETSDPDNLFASNQYVANKKTSLTFYIDSNVSNVVSYYSSVNYITIKKNGVAAYYFDYGYRKIYTTHSIPCEVGDVFTFWVRRSTNTNTTISTLRILEAQNVWPRDFVNPGWFLPKMKSIDVFKFIINLLGCSVYFDSISKTVIINSIDSLKREDSLDWSDKLINYNVNYDAVAKNNIIVWKQNDTSIIEKYNSQNKIEFANGNISFENRDIKNERYLFSLPFTSFNTLKNKNNFWLANVPLIKLLDSTDTFPTSTRAQIVSIVAYSMTDYAPSGGEDVSPHNHEYVRITEGANDRGLWISPYTYISGGSLSVTIYGLVNNYLKGSAIFQAYSYPSMPKIFSVKTQTPIRDISDNNTVNVLYEPFPSSFADARSITQHISSFISHYVSISNVNYLVFTKPKTGKPIDNWKHNLAIDNPDMMDLFQDPTIKELYFNKITKMMSNPNIEATILLSEADFSNFVFDKLVYLRKGDLKGYFFVTNIESYKDSSTPVRVKLLML